VNDFKWQINYNVKAIIYLLNCCQRLGKFNAVMCAKYHKPSVTYLIYTSQHSDVTHKELFSRNSEGLFQQDGARAHTSKATIAWLDANIKHYIPPEDWLPNSPDLSPIENVWSIMATAVQPILSLSHCKRWSTASETNGNQFHRQHFKILSVRCLTDWKQSLKIKETPFHTNSGQRPRLTLTFFSRPTLLCYLCYLTVVWYKWVL